MKATTTAATAPALVAALDAAAPGGVAARASDRLRYAHDASHYLRVPQAVVVPRTAGEVGALLRAAARDGFSLTFRSGGTSLSGQGGTEGVLVDTRRHFRDIEVLDSGARVRVQPGATVRSVNARLARCGRKLGPDPASEIACTIGGVVANNSSGMACGVHANTYRTLDSLVLVLPSGTVIDTGAPEADSELRRAEPQVHRGLLELRQRVLSDPESVATIERLFAMKNTMGYGLNAFLDFERPVDMLAHLVVGSEGTLAFVAEATFHTVPVHPHVATGLLVFASLADATASLPTLVKAGLATIELLDAASLRVAQRSPGVDELIASLAVDAHAALLVELQQSSVDELAGASDEAAALFGGLALTRPAVLTQEPSRRTALWHVRKGLYAAVAGSRPTGTTALLEDIAVPVENLLPTCESLLQLFGRYGYEDSVVFGHAKDGNVHFMLNEQFDRDGNVQRYLDFTDDMVDLVLGQAGTLKAEHGTGRMMAPYVRRQYGDELYDVMRRLKELVDPRGVLNPGVMLDEDPIAHVSHLKTTQTVEEEVDRCVECGYCEPVCPSKDVTLTPRQRIVLRRELSRAEAAGDVALSRELERDYAHDGLDTCAADGMCQTACPVLIDTGDLVRRLRAESTGSVQRKVGMLAADHWAGSTRLAAAGLSAASMLPPALMKSTSSAARAVSGNRTPAWTRELPRGGSPRRPGAAARPQAVYFPSCTSAVFGAAADGPGVGSAFRELCARAGIELRAPEPIASLCCGTPWKSKGLVDGYERMRERVLPALVEASESGRLPIVSDAVSCTEGLAALTSGTGLRSLDSVSFAQTTLLPRLPPRRKLGTVVVHPTCATTALGVTPALLEVARAIGDTVVVPDDWGCCGFAGDRGLFQPELTAAATAPAARALATVQADAYVSANRTCELGMTRATGQTYRHVLEVLEEMTR
jgi:D-lactate dehydrogenase